jgi:hypothetical protein
MSALAELQRQFQERVLHDDRAILRAVESGQNIAAAARVDVYAQAYRLRLTEALASNFPRLHDWVGAEAFAAIAGHYIASHPSRFRSIRWIGAELAACLELSHPEEPWIADLAQWEWALAAAFDAADAAPLSTAELASATPDRWPSLRFEFHPSVRILVLATNAPSLFKALADNEAAPAPAALHEPAAWLIWRQTLVTRFRSLDQAEHAALAASLSGGSFEYMCDALCATLAAEDVPLRAAVLLKSWIADGLIVGMRD